MWLWVCVHALAHQLTHLEQRLIAPQVIASFGTSALTQQHHDMCIHALWT